MLGINEGLTGNPAYYRDLYIKTLDRVTAVNPDIRIRVQSCTPVTKSRESSGRSNTGIDRFNGLLLEMCENYGYDYIDISSPMKGEDNSFRTDYTSDNYVHMSSQGCVSWINSLLEFARQKYIDGEWTPDSSPEDFPGVWIDF
ncbi:MAG: GDSL-type esterase/lipase family protein [Oscillospiraceae bacterium]|nr:GDSL-type esterase/lipase family protein [Oscillospiraceae bacterium]